MTENTPESDDGEEDVRQYRVLVTARIETVSSYEVWAKSAFDAEQMAIDLADADEPIDLENPLNTVTHSAEVVGNSEDDMPEDGEEEV